jgi:hypothetical protein
MNRKDDLFLFGLKFSVSEKISYPIEINKRISWD